MIRKYKTTPYQRGYAFERRVKKILEKQQGPRGWVIRQGKSAFPDLIVIEKATDFQGNIMLNPTYGIAYSKVYFVECRVDGYISPDERAKLLHLVDIAGGDAFIASRVSTKVQFKSVREAKV